MFYRRRNKRKKWEKSYIKKVFNNRGKDDDNFFNVLLNNVELINEKNDYLPNTLYKYYPPTSDNILDIKNKRVWLSHPFSFNDPFDCNIGYDYLNYEKKSLLNYINMRVKVKDEDNFRESFTLDDIDKIVNSDAFWDLNYSNRNYYSDILRKILKKKSDSFKKEINNFIRKNNKELELKVNKLRSINIRVACFSKFEKYEEFYKKIQMWSHYADNHKGFCVEYDISSLKNNTVFSMDDYEYYDKKDEYLGERLEAVIKGGLFPITYTSRRVNFSYTKLNKLHISDDGILKRDKDVDEVLYKTFIVKSTNWSYEKEWRIIIDGNICDYYDNKLPFPYIKRIYLGCKMDKKLINTFIEIGEELGVEVVMLEMNNKKFILEEKSINNYKCKRQI